MNSYKDYYVKTIESNSDLKGFKLVLGGTGLGKTYGLRETINEYLNIRENKHLKFIYITNRHNLITEQERKLNKQYGISSTYLKSNKDIILSLRNNDDGLHSIIESLERIDYFQYDASLGNEYSRNTKFKKLINGIDSKCQMLEDMEQQNSIRDTISRELGFECSDIFNILKRQLTLISRKNKSLHQQLLQDEIIWKLFPYVEFENNPNCNVLLITIQKVLRGFFDGKKDIKLASIEDKVIFLDEFDFLESDVLEILCDEPSIINPLEFVSIFYEGFKHWSKAPFWNGSKELETVKEKFNDVIQYIENSCEKHSINLSTVVDFRLSKNIKIKQANVLFQTSQTITPKPFFLREADNSWVIESRMPKDSINPRMLFSVLTASTNKIVGVFNYFKNNQSLVDEIIQKIWNQKNDNQSGVYEKYIKENMLYHRTKPTDVHSAEWDKDRTAYEIGYRLIKLFQRTNSFDPFSAELSQVELFTTPEFLIAKLSDNNLVFALSATADIPRTLGSFNIQWLEQNSCNIALDNEDYGLIQRLRDEKAEKRKTSVQLKIAKELDEDSLLQQKLQILLRADFFGDIDSATWRLRRVSQSFHTIGSILESNKFSHLVFLTTFKQLKKIIVGEGVVRDVFTQGKDGVFEVEILDSENKFFQLKYNKKSCNLIFLSAQDARQLEESEIALKEYRKAFQAEKVIVITQYKSASNGVNLPCYDKSGRSTDFRGLHLLEENHFWFSDEEEDMSKFKNIEKQAFWYLWKLWHGRQISKYDFKIHLNKRAVDNHNKPNIKAFNKLYRNTEEKTLNAISLYHQAIGRIEREKERIEEVDITLDRGVLEEFYRYLTTESFMDMTSNRDAQITSSLILEIQKQVTEWCKRHQIKEAFNRPQSIKSDNDRSKELISRILNEIERVKNKEYAPEVSRQVKENWELIREYVLKHKFNHRFEFTSLSEAVDFERDLCFETNRVLVDGTIYIDNAAYKIYKTKPIREVFCWDLNYAYMHIKKNDIICQYFEKHGYKTQFELNSIGYKTILTPYIHQAILKGAIGEKGIEALLNYEGIDLESGAVIPDELFEVVDGKIKDLPVYVDFKNFSNLTLDQFGLDENEPDYAYEFDSEVFINKLVNKYQKIAQFDSNPIFYIINLHSRDRREPDYFDSKGNRVRESNKSCIRIIPSALMPDDANKITPIFQSFIQEIIVKYEEV